MLCAPNCLQGVIRGGHYQGWLVTSKVLSCNAVPYACAAMLTAIAPRSDPETVPATYQDRAGDTGQPAARNFVNQ